MGTITIEIISDIFCVWCFIGKRSLERAITLFQKTYPDANDDTFVLQWRPYYLNLNHATPSVDKAELIDKRFAKTSAEKRNAMTNRLMQVGSSLGINFAWGGKIGSSRDAHRLVYLSEGKEPAVRDALVEGLFRAHHEREMDVSNKEVLRRVAVEAGIEGVEVDAWLAADEGGKVVDEEAARGRTRTTGVPAFFVQGVGRVDGAQDVGDFMEAFIRVKEMNSE